MNHVHINGVSMVIGMLNHLPERQDRAIRAALVSCGKLAMREAKDNAPVSPKNSILSATLKRKKRTARKTFPGGLEKSIQYEVQGVGKNAECSVFVASNSPAGKYARRIHDEKGKTWRNRGPGTGFWLFNSAFPLIDVAFLNGRQTPIVETANADFNQLGIQMRCYFDYGCAAGEVKAAYYGTGANA